MINAGGARGVSGLSPRLTRDRVQYSLIQRCERGGRDGNKDASKTGFTLRTPNYCINRIVGLPGIGNHLVDCTQLEAIAVKHQPASPEN